MHLTQPNLLHILTHSNNYLKFFLVLAQVVIGVSLVMESEFHPFFVHMHIFDMDEHVLLSHQSYTQVRNTVHHFSNNAAKRS